MSRSASFADARRSSRFWASAALAVLLVLVVLQLDDAGPGLVMAGLASVAALWLVLRYPRPAAISPNRAGRIYAAARIALFAGLAIAIAAFAVSRIGEQRASFPPVCEGQDPQIGNWKVARKEITPIAGNGFTALQATLEAKRGDDPPVILKPELRSWMVPGPEANTPDRARLWDGDLTLGIASYDERYRCMGPAASWRPFAGWARLGGWLAVLGAVLMTLVALGSQRWRVLARERIAMRREDRPLPAKRPVAARRQATPFLAMGLFVAAILGAVALVALNRAASQPRTASADLPAFTGGPALLAARLSLRETKTIPSSWMVIADAMARHGQFGEAAHVLLGAVEKQPRDPEAWLTLGDALFAHAGGQLTPAAVLAYDRADEASMGRDKPPVLTGTAFERSGRTPLVAGWWERRIKGLAMPSPWRAELEQRLAAAKSSQSGPSTAAPAP